VREGVLVVIQLCALCSLSAVLFIVHSIHTDMCRVKSAFLESMVDLTPSTTRFCLTLKTVELVVYQLLT